MESYHRLLPFVLVSLLSSSFGAVVGGPVCGCPIDAIYNFEDSMSDTGNLNREAPGPSFSAIANCPYGKKTMTQNSSVMFLLLLLLSTMIITATLLQQVTGEISITSQQQQQQQMDPNLHKQQDSIKDVYRSWYGRIWMIGSTAPSCTYNECRGCRFKCRAEQIPVDANDPINSAYHYKCVCHG